MKSSPEQMALSQVGEFVIKMFLKSAYSSFTIMPFMPREAR